jgi:hypothetical protein
MQPEPLDASGAIYQLRCYRRRAMTGELHRECEFVFYPLVVLRIS